MVNELIRFPTVLLIGPNGEQLGTMSSREAQMKANEYDLDLLCVAPNAQPPVCKIINYGKYRFEQQKKAKEARKNQHTIVLGDHEKEDGTVTYRKYGSQEQITVKINDFIAMIDEEKRLRK